MNDERSKGGVPRQDGLDEDVWCRGSGHVGGSFESAGAAFAFPGLC